MKVRALELPLISVLKGIGICEANLGFRYFDSPPTASSFPDQCTPESTVGSLAGVALPDLLESESEAAWLYMWW